MNVCTYSEQTLAKVLSTKFFLQLFLVVLTQIEDLVMNRVDNLGKKRVQIIRSTMNIPKVDVRETIYVV